MVSRRKFTTLHDAVCSVKCPSQKLVKLNIWCKNKGLDMMIVKLEGGKALLQVFTQEEFRSLIYMKEFNLVDYGLNDLIVTIAEDINLKYLYYQKIKGKPQFSFSAGRKYPVYITYRGDVVRITSGIVYGE